MAEAYLHALHECPVRLFVLVRRRRKARLLELVVDVEEHVKRVHERALAGGWAAQLEIGGVSDALKNPAGGGRATRIAPPEPRPDGKVECMRVARAPHGRQDLGQVVYHVAEATEGALDLSNGLRRRHRGHILVFRNELQGLDSSDFDAQAA